VAYQGDGDVTGKLVYVNYGMPDDYKMLERLGVGVRGAIVIARYGKGWRGLKPRLARSTARSAASSIPILPTMVMRRIRHTPTAQCAHRLASSAVRSPT